MRARYLIVLAPALLSACADASSALTAASALTTIWFYWPPDPAVAEAPPLPPVAPLYCYRTLGEKVCHAEALPGAEGTRLIGQVGAEANAP